MNIKRIARGLALGIGGSALLGAGTAAYAIEAPAETIPRFAIRAFAVTGNSLLPTTEVESLTRAYIGEGRSYADVQKALESLERAYHSRGYGTVQVYVPEQELTGGVVTLQVTEGRIGQVIIKGNQHFTDENIRAAVPDLREGTAPNMRRLSENIQLANENPARQMELVLGVAEEEGKVNARLDVTEENPERFFLTLDDTGTHESGRHRIGASYQNANLFNSDQVLTLAYITTPDAPSGVKVDILSAGYRWPLYNLGDSIDVIYANSSTNTPATLSTGVDVVGKGEVFAVRYNHIFPRIGEYASRLIVGMDYKYVNAVCSVDGVSLPNCLPYTVRPVTLTYTGKREQPGQTWEYSIGVMYNVFPFGAEHDFYNGSKTDADLYSAASGYEVKDRFGAMRVAGSFSTAMENDWMWRLAFNAQLSGDALVSGERLGLAGSTAVRGFKERALFTDSGIVTNVELYSPDFANLLGVPGALQGVFFYDTAAGRNSNEPAYKPHIASVGVGLRYSFKKDITARFDFAQVVDGFGKDDQVVEGNLDTRTHFSLAIGF